MCANTLNFFLLAREAFSKFKFTKLKLIYQQQWTKRNNNNNRCIGTEKTLLLLPQMIALLWVVLLQRHAYLNIPHECHKEIISKQYSQGKRWWYATNCCEEGARSIVPHCAYCKQLSASCALLHFECWVKRLTLQFTGCQRLLSFAHCCRSTTDTLRELQQQIIDEVKVPLHFCALATWLTVSIVCCQRMPTPDDASVANSRLFVEKVLQEDIKPSSEVQHFNLHIIVLAVEMFIEWNIYLRFLESKKA